MWFCASAAWRWAHCQSDACSSIALSVQKRQTTDASRSSMNEPGVRSVNYMGRQILGEVMRIV